MSRPQRFSALKTLKTKTIRIPKIDNLFKSDIFFILFFNKNDFFNFTVKITNTIPLFSVSFF